MNGQREPRGGMQNSVWVGGSAGGPIQNVHGKRASASMNVSSADADPVDTLRTLLRAASLTSKARDSYERALDEVESARPTWPRHISSARKAMKVLTTAATTISGWTDALEALRHVFPGL
jgi:hypothetical protein